MFAGKPKKKLCTSVGELSSPKVFKLHQEEPNTLTNPQPAQRWEYILLCMYSVNFVGHDNYN
jgi:hypothetical protein